MNACRQSASKRVLGALLLPIVTISVLAQDYPGAVDFTFTPGTPVISYDSSRDYGGIAYSEVFAYGSNSLLALPQRRFESGQVHFFDEDGIMHHLIHQVNENWFLGGTMVQPSGRVVVRRSLGDSNGLIRLNQDGSLDPSFTSPDLVNPQQMQQLPDGRFYVLGDVIGASRTNNGFFKLKRLTVDGKPDPVTFSPEGISFAPFVFSAQSDYKVIVASNTRIDRLTEFGGKDPSFNAPTDFRAPANITVGGIVTVLAASDGRVYVGGVFTNVAGFSASGLVRLNSDGTLDETFHFSHLSSAPDSTVLDLAETPDGILVVASDYVTKVNSNGGGANFSTQINGARKAAILSDYYVLAGTATQNGLVRLFPNGQIDTRFNPEPPSNVLCISRTATNLIVTAESAIFILSSNGVSIKKVPFGSNITATARLQSGEIVASLHGGFSPVFDRPSTRLLSYTPETSKLAAFGPKFRSFYSISQLVSRLNGKLMVIGQFDAVLRTNYMQLNIDGSIDTSWPDFSSVLAASETGNGSVILFANGSLIKLTKDGTLDPAFFPPTLYFYGPFPQLEIVPANNGGVFILGPFEIKGSAQFKMVKLTPTGEIDSSFNPEYPSDVDLPYIAKEQVDGKIVVLLSGYETSIARLEASGRLDPSFRVALLDVITGDVPSGCMEFTSNTDILVGGAFNRVNGLDFPGIVRLRGDSALIPLTLNASTRTNVVRLSFVGNPAKTLAIQQSTDLSHWTALTTLTNFSGNTTLNLQMTSNANFVRASISQL